eukprot:5274282-Prymnesium_polylepis.2
MRRACFRLVTFFGTGTNGAGAFLDLPIVVGLSATFYVCGGGTSQVALAAGLPLLQLSKMP